MKIGMFFFFTVFTN